MTNRQITNKLLKHTHKAQTIRLYPLIFPAYLTVLPNLGDNTCEVGLSLAYTSL